VDEKPAGQKTMGKCKPGAIAGMAAKKKTEAAEQIISAAFEIGSTLRQNSVQASSLQVGFVLALIGFALGLFSPSFQLDLFS
jgi:hypothetical protein